MVVPWDIAAYTNYIVQIDLSSDQTKSEMSDFTGDSHFYTQLLSTTLFCLNVRGRLGQVSSDYTISVRDLGQCYVSTVSLHS